jgi:HEPN domain-containing protein
MENREILLNTFAIRSFREIADQDYIAARLSFRAQLIPQFLWQSLQALEKYLKCILVLNRIKAPKSHELAELLKDLDKSGKFKIRLSDEAKRFIEYLDTYGRFRYYETPYYTVGRELYSLDRTVWEIRRYAKVLDYDLRNAFADGIRMFNLELEAIERAESQPPQEFGIIGGLLEQIIDRPKHPSRSALIWNNAYYGRSKRKSVTYPRMMASGNSPLSLYPHILDDVLEYVWLPKDVKMAYRKLIEEKDKEKLAQTE